MKRGEVRLPRGPKSKRVTPAPLPLDASTEHRLAESVAAKVLERLRIEAPDIFSKPAEAPHA